MDKIIFLDIETDGKYKIIQISYIITCSKLKVLSSHNHFLNDGSDAIDYYKKITIDFIKDNGKHPSIVLKEVAKNLEECSTIVGHNIGFDIGKLQGYFNYYKINYKIPENIYDTMHKSKDIVKALNVKGQIKYPKLQELGNYYGIVNNNAHDGLSDVMVTYECYKNLINNNKLEELEELEEQRNHYKQSLIEYYPVHDDSLLIHSFEGEDILGLMEKTKSQYRYRMWV